MSAIIDFAEKLRAQIDIVDVVGQYVELRRTGVNHKGLCPMHREKTPSFTVSSPKQIFHCFGCNQGGDVIKFVQLVEKMEWIEAVKHLAERYRIPMPVFRPTDTVDKQEKDAKERLLAVNRAAVEHFTSRLTATIKDPSTEIAKYLQRRKLDPEICQHFQLGLSMDAWQDFLNTAKKAGFEQETAVAAGLAIRNPETGRTYDRFRKRLIFPIHDPHGKPVAFGGRVYASDASPEEPKYVNSPETMLYHKGRHLYALHLAKEEITRRGYAILMEGYMDVLRAHQHGFVNAVASCGTALTDEQAGALEKFCRKVVFAYDGDAAGQKAMLRGCEVLLEHEFEIKVIVLSAEHDPDSFLVENGSEGFQQEIDKARNFFSFFLTTAAKQFNPETGEGKVQIVDFVLPLLRRMRKDILRNEYIRKTADFLNIEPVLIARHVQSSASHNSDQLRKQVDERVPNTATPLEKMLIRLYVEAPQARAELAEVISPDWLRNPLVKKWLTQFCDKEGHCAFSWQDLFAGAEGEEEEKFLRELALSEEPVDPQPRTIQHLAARLEVNYRKQANLLLARQMHEFYSETKECDNDLTRTLDDSAQKVKTAGEGYFIGKPASKIRH